MAKVTSNNQLVIEFLEKARAKTRLCICHVEGKSYVLPMLREKRDNFESSNIAKCF